MVSWVCFYCRFGLREEMCAPCGKECVSICICFFLEQPFAAANGGTDYLTVSVWHRLPYRFCLAQITLPFLFGTDYLTVSVCTDYRIDSVNTVAACRPVSAAGRRARSSINFRKSIKKRTRIFEK
ncbi:hypothetical protein MmiAt1_00440 [Methanimicrococcus sp. At1]|uniref:Secreted protein n=1 Tax=Methanimicrococcus hacksteinii TaxID=3028293 RepID=A0ABU3VM88_9EURY|nr:hypothetical protein [Methanimicrococcus sp. At1]MDV0444518.1 hypothetical protein [Methanimicrococcus sp. At1]